jgi:hypothetical protein
MSVLWKILTSRITGYAILLAVLAFATYKGYDYVLQKGVEQEHKVMQPKVDAAVAAKTKAEAELSTYKASYKQWVAESDAAALELKKQQAQIVLGLTKQLSDAKHKYAALKDQKEVEAYVSEKSMAACTIPAGFVSLFNDSIENPEAVLVAGSTGSIGFDADAPSGVDLLAVAQATQRNNAQAMYWRAQVIAWQQWYATYSAAIKKLNENLQKNSIYLQKTH